MGCKYELELSNIAANVHVRAPCQEIDNYLANSIGGLAYAYISRLVSVLMLATNLKPSLTLTNRPSLYISGKKQIICLLNPYTFCHAPLLTTAPSKFEKYLLKSVMELW